MEITRNSRTVQVSLPYADTSELISVRFENASSLTHYNFGEDAPTDADVFAGAGYINSDTEVTYVADDLGHPESIGNKFTPDLVAVSVPYDFVTYCGKFDVKWTYTVAGKEYTETQQHDVVQPLFTPAELKAFDDDFNTISENAINRLERTIRAIIERTTGQTFELTYGTQVARSHNGGTLVLPKRAVALDGYKGLVAGVPSSLESDGWIVRAQQPWTMVSHMSTNPIYEPYAVSSFREGTYKLSGEWGYRSVPDQIVLAAMILAQDYGCKESVWRDRYIESMKASDWGVIFHDKAFVGTGNVKVDQILQSYTLNKMVVI